LYVKGLSGGRPAAIPATDARLVVQNRHVTEPCSDMTDSNRRVLQAIYDQLRDRGAWPTFA